MKKSGRQAAIAAAATNAAATARQKKEAAKLKTAAQQKASKTATTNKDGGQRSGQHGGQRPPTPEPDVDMRLQRLESAMGSVDELKEQLQALTIAIAAAARNESADESREDLPDQGEMDTQYTGAPVQTAGRPQTQWPQPPYNPYNPYVPYPRELAMDPIARRYMQKQAEMAMPNFVPTPPQR